jgi:hypothetical protein
MYSIYSIQTALIKKPYLRKDAEIGEVLFRLSREYVEAAKSNGVEFYEAKPMHRLAAFLLKFDHQSMYYVPAWNTLCLSNYIHQEKRFASTLSFLFSDGIFLFLLIEK